MTALRSEDGGGLGRFGMGLEPNESMHMKPPWQGLVRRECAGSLSLKSGNEMSKLVRKELPPSSGDRMSSFLGQTRTKSALRKCVLRHTHRAERPSLRGTEHRPFKACSKHSPEVSPPPSTETTGEGSHSALKGVSPRQDTGPCVCLLHVPLAELSSHWKALRSSSDLNVVNII